MKGITYTEDDVLFMKEKIDEIVDLFMKEKIDEIVDRTLPRGKTENIHSN